MRLLAEKIINSQFSRWRFTVLPIIFMIVWLCAVAHAQEQEDQKKNLLLNGFTFTVPPHLDITNQTNNPLFRQGYLDVTLYNGWKDEDGNPHLVDKSGKKDSTVALQKALDDAVDYRLTAYFPVGKYKVSDTLHFVKKYRGGLLHRFSTTLVGEKRGDKRAIIRLKNGAIGFNDPEQIKPVLDVWRKRHPVKFGTPGNKLCDGILCGPGDRVCKKDESTYRLCAPGEEGVSNEQYSTGYWQRIQGIEIDCGKRNKGAVGLRFSAAQDSHIEDVIIFARDSFAGFYGLPSRTSAGAANIEVRGGEYGIYIPRYDAGSIIVGAVFRNQKTAAIHSEGFVPVSVVGFDIEKEAGPVVDLIESEGKGVGHRGTLSLIDGRVGVRKGGIAFKNDQSAGGKNLYLRNVYVKGTDELVISDSRAPITGEGRWKRIAEYANCETSFNRSYSLIDGNLDCSEIAIVVNNSLAPPSGLITRHVWQSLPWFEDEGVINAVTDFGAKGDDDIDDTAAIRAAINAAASGNGKVFLPKGEYLISKTLNLHSNTQLFGVARHLTWIRTHKSWKPSSQTPMIRTVNDASATTFLGHLSLQYESVNEGDSGNDIYDWFNPIHWRAGRNSMVVGVHTRAEGEDGELGRKTQGRKEFKITDNGGGRWYFMGRHQRKANVHPAYQILLVTGTNEPLWFYGLNLEKTTSDWMAEVRNSRNVRIFGPKTEGETPIMKIHSTENMALYGAGAMRFPPSGQAHFRLSGTSTGILMANINPQQNNQPPPSGKFTLLDDTSGGSIGVKYPNMVALFKRGVIDDQVMFSSSP
jgi:hypothetical protein